METVEGPNVSNEAPECRWTNYGLGRVDIVPPQCRSLIYILSFNIPEKGNCPSYTLPSGVHGYSGAIAIVIFDKRPR